MQNVIRDTTAFYSIQQGIIGLKGQPHPTEGKIAQFALDFAG